MDIIKNYFYLKDTSDMAIRKACKVSPLMVGVFDWWLVPKQNHAMVLIGEDNDGWVCVNWNSKKELDLVTLPFGQRFEFAVAFGEMEEGNAKLPLFSALWQVAKTAIRTKTTAGITKYYTQKYG